MANDPYNPIIHTGGKISSRDKRYNRDTSDSGGRSAKHTRFLDQSNNINNNSISYVNSSNVVVDRKRQNEQSLEFPAAYDAGGVVYKKDTASANGPYKRPQTVNGPLISPLVIAQVWTPPQRSGNLPYLGDPCDLADNGKQDPANPCFYCYNGYWLHLSEIRPLGECGEWREKLNAFLVRECEAHMYDFGACFECDPKEGVKPLCESACEECVEVQNPDGTIAGTCKDVCVNSVCINDICQDTCDMPTRPTEGWIDSCNKLACEECTRIDINGGLGGGGTINVCQSRCTPGKRCVDGRCVDNCWPHCADCEECVFKDGVYGCQLLPKYSESLASGYEVICCTRESKWTEGLKITTVVGWKPPCESLGPDCTVVDECAKQGQICVEEYGPGVTIPTRSCKPKCRQDSDCGPCEACDDTSVNWGRCYSTCGKGELCNNGVCEKAPECKSCEELDFLCDDKDRLTDMSCWGCVNTCPQDVLPLECLPVLNGKPGEHACQYLQSAIILADLVDTIP